jgi:hypothetical protein
MYRGKREKEGCESIPGRSRLIARTDLFKESAGFRQFGELGEVFSYCQGNCCIRQRGQPFPMTRRYLSAVEDMIRCFASVARADQVCVAMVESRVICGEISVEGSRCQKIVQGCPPELSLPRAACSRLEIESLVLLRGGGGPPRLECYFRLLSCDSS